MTVYDVLFKRGSTEEGEGDLVEVRGDARKGRRQEADQGRCPAVPVGPAWDGWLVISEKRKNRRG